MKLFYFKSQISICVAFLHQNMSLLLGVLRVNFSFEFFCLTNRWKSKINNVACDKLDFANKKKLVLGKIKGEHASFRQLVLQKIVSHFTRELGSRPKSNKLQHSGLSTPLINKFIIFYLFLVLKLI